MLRASRRWYPKKKESNPQNKLHQIKNGQAKNPKNHGNKDLSTVVCYNCGKKGLCLVFGLRLKMFHSFMMFLFMFLATSKIVDLGK